MIWWYDEIQNAKDLPRKLMAGKNNEESRKKCDQLIIAKVKFMRKNSSKKKPSLFDVEIRRHDFVIAC